MNGEALPYLNGFPVRLILPGFYSDSWVKMLSSITVTSIKPKLHFMDHAYRVPDNDCECETPENLSPKTKPIEEMNVNSLIGYPATPLTARRSKKKPNSLYAVSHLTADTASPK